SGLGGAHHGPHVVLAEDALDGDRLGFVHRDQVGQVPVQVEQPVGQILIRIGVDDVVIEQRARPPRDALHDADTTPGQPRVNAKNPHATPPAVRVFDTLPAACPTGTTGHASVPEMDGMTLRLRPVTEPDLDVFRRFASEPGLVGLDWSGYRDPQASARRFAADGYL